MKKESVLAIFLFVMTSGQVGINTKNPTETLDVNGIERVRELPKHQTINSIFTKPDGSYSGNKDQTFIATRRVVADANGVLGYIDGLSGDTGTPRRNITIGYSASVWDGNLYAIGGSGFPAFNSQLQNKLNYGANGVYNKVSGIDFLQFEGQINNYTAAQLKSIVDVFCIGVSPGVELDTAILTKIKDFSELGGVVVVLLDSGRNTQALQAFGGNGSVGNGTGVSYSITGTTGGTGIFGNVAGNTTIFGAQTAGRVSNSQLPPASTILATEGGAGTSFAGIWTTGTNGRILFFWDEGVFRYSGVNGTYIDTDQEKYLHNIMAYAFDKLNL